MNPLELLENPHVLHAFSAFFPVALAITLMPLVLFSAVMKMQWPAVRWMLVFLYLALAGAAFGALNTGIMVSSKLPAELPVGVNQLVELHRWMSNFLWMMGVATAVLILFCGIRTEWLRSTFSIFAVLASIATAGWAAFIGFHGLSLVYKHGLGFSSETTTVSTPAATTPVPKPAIPIAPVPPAAPVSKAVPSSKSESQKVAPAPPAESSDEPSESAAAPSATPLPSPGGDATATH